ncbi:MAG: response regulator [bacterium]|nr:response regulator [bacterium]
MKKILILEDEVIILELLTKKLQREGYEVKTAQNGKEGLAMMEKEVPDLVLTDVIMPEKDGFDVILEMKQNELLKNVPIIIISNSGQPVEIDRAKELGVDDWVIKTDFDPQEIVQKVQQVLAKTSPQGEV